MSPNLPRTSLEPREAPSYLFSHGGTGEPLAPNKWGRQPRKLGAQKRNH
jgi:hypothetical protein